VRPEKVRIASAALAAAPGAGPPPNRFAGVIRARTYLGPAIRYRVAVGDGLELLVDQPNRDEARCQVDEPVVVWWDAGDALVVATPAP
jgi:hypothetical protein